MRRCRNVSFRGLVPFLAVLAAVLPVAVAGAAPTTTGRPQHCGSRPKNCSAGRGWELIQGGAGVPPASDRQRDQEGGRDARATLCFWTYSQPRPPSPALLVSLPRQAAGVPAFWSDYDPRFLVPRLAVLAIVGAALLGIYLATRGKALPIRDIPGLLAFDEAVARATEMGRPTLFTTGGACDLRRVQLFASMPVLRRVSELSGQLGNRLIVPCCFPETMSVHINTMKDGYASVGAADMFRADDVRFFPGLQFFFAIASMGWMLEERPAACFYFGYWEADSLMFAETGQAVNAMQIAGTDQLAQVPFFIASCDYTIIGEEFWATSAKLSRDPALLGSLGAQDLFKLSVLVLIVLGSAACALPWFADLMEKVRTALK